MTNTKPKSWLLDSDTLKAPLVGIAIDQHNLSAAGAGAHHHQPAQVLYATSGMMHFYCDNRYSILPPSKAAFIPSNMVHTAFSKTPVDYRSIYIDIHYFKHYALPEQMFIFDVSLLLKALILKACEFGDIYIDNSTQSRVALLILDEIMQAKAMPYQVMRPTEKRLLSVFKLLQDPDYLACDVNTIAKHCHLSTRTLSRLCQQVLHVSFEKWRMQFKLLKMIEWLEAGSQVAVISDALGYANPSACIAMFKRMMGVTPTHYLQTSHQVTKDLQS